MNEVKMINKMLIILTTFIIFTGCAFKNLETCGAEGEGNGCTPISKNMEMASAGGVTSSPKSPDITMDSNFDSFDRNLLKDELNRISPRSNSPQPLNATEVKIRIYPYSDGDRFYDVRDIYLLIHKPGWARGSLVYTPVGTVNLSENTEPLPGQLRVKVEQLNVRTGPNALFDSIAVLSWRTAVYPKEYRDGWYLIEARKGKQEISGWVHSGYVE